MKFKKKPITIEAEQFNPDIKPYPEGVEITPNCVSGNKETGWVYTYNYWIKTLEGIYEVTPGDWIITGIKGEKYPCKPDIFNLTYEPA